MRLSKALCAISLAVLSISVATIYWRMGAIRPGRLVAIEPSLTWNGTAEGAMPHKVNTRFELLNPVHLRLKMIGNRLPPFLLSSSGDLSFQNTKSLADTRNLYVTTLELERGDRTPTPRCSLPFVRIDFVNMVEQPALKQGTFNRTYKFHVSLTAPPQGSFAGEIVIPDPWRDSIHQTVQIHGSPESPFKVVPSALNLTVTNGTAGNDAKILVVVNPSIDPDDIALVPEDGAPLTIERHPSTDRRILFAIRAVPVLATPGQVWHLVISSGPGDASSVKIPVTMR